MAVLRGLPFDCSQAILIDLDAGVPNPGTAHWFREDYSSVTWSVIDGDVAVLNENITVVPEADATHVHRTGVVCRWLLVDDDGNVLCIAAGGAEPDVRDVVVLVKAALDLYSAFTAAVLARTGPVEAVVRESPHLAVADGEVPSVLVADVHSEHAVALVLDSTASEDVLDQPRPAPVPDVEPKAVGTVRIRSLDFDVPAGKVTAHCNQFDAATVAAGREVEVDVLEQDVAPMKLEELVPDIRCLSGRNEGR